MKILSKHELHSLYQENTLQMEILALRLERIGGQTEELKKIQEIIEKRKENEFEWRNIKLA